MVKKNPQNKNSNLIRLSKSLLSVDEKKAVNKVLEDGYLGMGKYVGLFEENLKNLLKREAVCVVNGTAALQLALQGCDIGKGDEVLVQSITYLASFQAISAVGAIPIPCDIETNSLTLSIEDAKNKITKKTKAIMPVHYAGHIGKYNEIYDLAKKNNLRVIEDAAHAFGTKEGNKLVGSFGDIVCFSFDGIKNITSGEGGCIVTCDEKVLKRVKDLRLLGVINDSESRYAGKRSWEFDVNEQGWRYHMSDLMAAIGIEQLKKLDEFREIRQQLAMHYDMCLTKNPSFRILEKNYKNVLPHIYPIILSNKINREELQAYLLKNRIQTGIHYKPNHLLSYYSKNFKISLPNTDSIYKNILTLPLHADLKKEDINYICKKIKDFIEN